jgi:hypothetical protein
MTEPTISVEKLLEAGYVEYGQSTNDYGVRTFQKKFTDEKGVKFFIDCKYYFFSINGKQSRFWDFKMQINTEKGSVEFTTMQWFNQDGVHSGRTIKEVEEYFEWLWNAHGKPYYEVY